MKVRLGVILGVLLLCSAGLVWADEQAAPAMNDMKMDDMKMGDMDMPAAPAAGEEQAATTEAVLTAPEEVGNKICPISGEKIVMGKESKVEYNGKTYNLCCAMCEKDFNKDPEAAIKKLEEMEKTAGAEDGQEHHNM